MASVGLRNTILDLLVRIEQGGSYSHLLINRELKSQKVSERDGRLLTEIVYGTLQHQGTLDYFLHDFINPNKKQKPWVRQLLRMSVYQMVYLDKVPDHAIIHEAVEIAKKRGHKGMASFVNGVLRNIQRQGIPDPAKIKDSIQRLAVETSHPRWLVEQWIHDYGYELAEGICYANLQHQVISARIQPMKITRDEAMTQLTKEGFVVEPSLISYQGIIIHYGNVLTSSLFEQGMMTVQDQSSMLVGDMVGVQPGMTVLDVCSAPGGKVTHLAEHMNNQGVIKAHDLHENKLKLIDEKVKQLSLSIIETTQADARQLDQKYPPDHFDCILVDAPCTGFGVIRGKPEIKWHKQKEDICQLANIQLDILQHVAPLLKKRGHLVYSTCTVNKRENDQVVKTFLEKNEEFIIDSTLFDSLPDKVKDSPGQTNFGLQLFPQTFQTDGFFLTRMVKIG